MYSKGLRKQVKQQQLYHHTSHRRISKRNLVVTTPLKAQLDKMTYVDPCASRTGVFKSPLFDMMGSNPGGLLESLGPDSEV